MSRPADATLDALPAGRARALAVAVALLIALPLVLPVVLGVRTIGDDAALDNDALYQREPSPPPRPVTTDLSGIAVDLGRDRVLAAGFRRGRLVEWSPLAGTGMPLWAEQGNPFFPLKLPFYLWPSRRMYDLTLLSRLLVAALGAYVLARVRGLGRAGALVAAGTFELSGTLLANLSFATAGASCLLPWAAAVAYRLVRRPDRRTIGAAALVLGGAVLAGHPTLGLVVFLTFATTLAGLLPRGTAVGRMGMAAGGAVVLALVMAAPAELPFLHLLDVGELYKNTPMSRLLNAVQLGVARNTSPIALFVPGVFVGPSIVDPHAIAAAVGPLVLGLAVAGLCVGGLDLPLALVGILGIVIATAPVPTQLLPLLRFVVPPYAWPLVALAVTQAAGAGATAGLERRGPVLAALAVLALGPASLALVRDADNPYGAQYATQLRTAFADAQHALVLLAPLGMALLVLTVVGLFGRPRRASYRATLLLAASVVTQLAVLGPLVLRAPSRVLDAPASPAVEFLRTQLADGQSRFTGAGSIGFPMTSLLFGLRDLRCVAGLPLRRYVEFLSAGGASTALNRRTADQYLPLESPLLDLAATRWVVHPRQGIGAGTLPMPIAYQDARVAIYERRTVLRRARVVHRIEPVPDEGAAYARLVAGRNQPVDPHVAIVEPDEQGGFPAALVDGPQLEPVVIVQEDDPDRVALQAVLSGAGLVVVADSYYPGWTARVDGQAVPIYPTDLLFRGVRVPAGRHRVEFVYAPSYARWSIALGALAAGVAFAAWLWPARRT